MQSTLVVLICLACGVFGCSQQPPEKPNISQTAKKKAEPAPQPSLKPDRVYGVSAGRDLDITPDGAMVAVATDYRKIFVWNTSENLIEHIDADLPDIACCAFTPDGSQLAYAAGSLPEWQFLRSEVKILSTDATQDATELVDCPRSSMQDVAFSNSGKYLAVVGAVQFVGIYDLENRSWKRKGFGARKLFNYTVAWSPDDKRIATGGTRNVKVYSIRDDENDSKAGYGEHWIEDCELDGVAHLVSSVCFDNSGQRILTTDWKYSVRIWDSTSGKLLVKYQGHNDAVEAACFSPDERFVVSGGWSGELHIWDSETGEGVRKIKCADDGHIRALAIRPGTDELFCLSGNGSSVEVWNMDELFPE